MVKKAELTGLAHIGVFTQDLETSIAFYKKLGFKEDARSMAGTTKLGFVSLGTCLIELIQPADAEAVQARCKNGIVAHICIECTGIKDVVDGFKAQGLIPADAQATQNDEILDGIKNIFFDGPSGESIELMEYFNR